MRTGAEKFFNSVGDERAGAAMSNWTLRATVLVILIGVALRTALYLSNPPFWVDEAWLVLNIVERDWRGLLAPLDNDQAAPIGFLLIEQASYVLAGLSEFGLRLFPWLVGLATLPLFLLVARRTSRSPIVPLALFAISAPLIRYSAEVKQYGLDVALILLLTAVALRTERLTRGGLVAWSMLGAVVVWFSFPAVFVLASIGITMAITELRRGGWTRAWRLVPVALCWLASFLALYVVQIRALSQHDYLNWYWESGFMPFSAEAFEWLRRSMWSLQDMAGLRVLPLALFVAFALTGAIVMLRTRRYRALALLLGPILCALVLAVLHIFPFAARLVLFSAPAMILLAAESVHIVRWPVIPALILIGAMSWGVFAYERAPALEVRPAVRYVREHAQRGDLLGTVYRTERERRFLPPAVRLYALQYRLGEVGIVWADSSRAASSQWLITYPGPTSQSVQAQYSSSATQHYRDVDVHRIRR